MTPKPTTGWTPVKRGDSYCSPRCGCGCTWADYCLAHTRGDELVAQLGPTWEKRVWENMGWHWSVKKGVMDIHPRQPIQEGYTIFFNIRPQVLVKCTDLEKGICEALEKASEAAQKIATELNRFAVNPMFSEHEEWRWRQEWRP